MVPVGGAVIAGFDKKLIADVSKSYPGLAYIILTSDKQNATLRTTLKDVWLSAWLSGSISFYAIY